ncbi:hypothetical protein R5R35_001598 [Gryllus longicercus]|uniref:Pickpocket n=1 Tax=Gryllus longicercus TaxID=2509291 RepID=A0AAN9WGB1_9ORTH
MCRVLWTIGITVALTACVWLMYKTANRWVESPVIIAMDETQRAVWQIPFPAVTVCPQAKINGFLNLTDFINKFNEGLLTKDQKELLAQVQTPCKIPLIIDNNNEINESNPTTAIEDHALDLQEVVKAAYLQSQDAMFEPILTEEGLCYSFNMMPAAEFFREGTFHAAREKYLKYNISKVQWDPTRGYDDGIDEKAYPLRALGAGKEPGFQVHLHTKTKFLHSVCNFMGQGYQVLLHSPIEFPQLGKQSIYVPLDSVVQISLTPSEIRTNEQLRRSYTTSQRQCYFPDEKYLMYFKHYTQSNCELECLSNLTWTGCGCVEFYMPRKPDTPVCGMNKKLCVKGKAAFLNEITAGVWKRENPEKKSGNKADHPCGCLPSCMEIQYHNDKSRTELDLELMNRYLKQERPSSTEEDNDSRNRSIIFIYFKHSHYIPIRRIEVFGTTDLLASLGGVMGLCMGISLLSVIEFFYWMLVRPWCQQIKQKDPLLRSIKKNSRTQNADAAVQYSRYMEDDAAKSQR